MSILGTNRGPDPAGTIRNRLARLLDSGSTADRPVVTLSGGERFRVSSVGQRRLLARTEPSLGQPDLS
ncbi:hypothetical protein EGT67_18720 [Prescottella agglutinans]|uniref:Uncharacterized protein n=1 Tax=Prescottella agglutinans TaxID=1644129 RepID=A0A438BB70_9NOCA|nr:hypothetical protein EGT67_18720 [Prescottella agglutinans]